jgi:hypothetical protein
MVSFRLQKFWLQGQTSGSGGWVKKKIAATNDVGDDGIVDGSSAITKTMRIRACLIGRQIRIPFLVMVSRHAREFCGSVTANIGWYVVSEI